MLLVVDRSKSLKVSDTANRRVEAIQSTVQMLDDSRQASIDAGDPLDVYLDVLTFGTVTTRLFGGSRAEWAPLNDVQQVLPQLEGLRTANDSEDTDYVSALEPYADRSQKPAGEVGAIEMLERAPEGACRLLVWFTDGEFDFDFLGQPKVLEWAQPPFVIDSVEAGEAARAAGRDVLCGADGLVDRLRAGEMANGSSAYVQVVALNDAELAPDFSLVQSVATNEGSTCGSLEPRGSFTEAANIDELVYSLVRGVLGRDDGSEDGDAVACDASADASCLTSVGDQPLQPYDYPFYLSGGIKSFNLLTLTGNPAVLANIVTPTGEVIPLDGPANLSPLEGVELNITELPGSDRVYQVKGLLDDSTAAWVGQWRVRFTTQDPAAADDLINRASIYVFGNTPMLRIREGASLLRKGQNGELVVEMVTPGGVRMTRPEFAPVPELDVRVDGEPVEAGPPNADGTWVIPVEVPADMDSNSVHLTGDLTAYLTVAPDAKRVEVQSWKDIEIGKYPVEDPITSPDIPGPIGSFGVLDQKQKSGTSSLLVEATSVNSAGCVTLVGNRLLDSTTFQGDADIAVLYNESTVEPGEQCAIQVAQGETAELVIQLEIEPDSAMSSSQIEGELEFVSVGEEGKAPVTFVKPFTATVEPVLVSSTQAKPVLVAVLFAIILPILLLYLANYLMATFRLAPMNVLRIPVRWSNGTLNRLKDGNPMNGLEYEDDEVRVNAPSNEEKYRQVTVGDIEVRSSLSWWPFNEPWVSAKSPLGDFIISTGVSEPKKARARVKGAVSSAFFLAASTRPQKDTEADVIDNGLDVAPFDAVLTIALPIGASQARRYVEEHLHDWVEHINDLVDRWAVAVESEPTVAEEMVEHEVSNFDAIDLDDEEPHRTTAAGFDNWDDDDGSVRHDTRDELPDF